jgi:hypothetical protein
MLASREFHLGNRWAIGGTVMGASCYVYTGRISSPRRSSSPSL